MRIAKTAGAIADEAQRSSGVRAADPAGDREKASREASGPTSERLAGPFAVEVGVEEGGDAVARVEGGFLVVADIAVAQNLEDEVAAVMVHEGVSGTGVFLHIEGGEGAFKGALQLVGGAFLKSCQTAVAADDGAGGFEEVVDMGRKLAAAVDAGGGEAVAGGEHEGESAAHAEADEPILPEQLG